MSENGVRMVQRVIEVLRDHQLRHVYGSPDEGLMAATFRCDVQWGGGKVLRTYVKCFPKAKRLGLVNEVTGYLLARSAGVPVPARAGLLKIPAAAFPDIDLSEYLPYSFAIIESEGRTLVSSFRVNDLVLHSAMKDIIRNWSMLPGALAFDDWVANCDRNQGNILIAGPEMIALIDHSNLPVTINWDVAMLDPNLNSINMLAAIVHGQQNPTPPEVAIEMEKATVNHNVAYQDSSGELHFWWNQLLPNDKKRLDALHAFLEIRARDGHLRIASQCGAKVA